MLSGGTRSSWQRTMTRSFLKASLPFLEAGDVALPLRSDFVSSFFTIRSVRSPTVSEDPSPQLPSLTVGLLPLECDPVIARVHDIHRLHCQHHHQMAFQLLFTPA